MSPQPEPLGGPERPGAALPWPWLVALYLLMLPALLRAGFALDDRELLFENPVTGGSLSLWAAFGRDYFHHLGDSGQWRPIASLSLRLDHLLFGTWAAGYHLVNGLLHLGVVACTGEILRRLRFPTGPARLGLVLFALHPVLADSVVWIAGRTSMLSALLPLAGFLLAGRALSRGARWSPWVIGGLGLLLGLLSKEDAVVFAPFLLCLGWTVPRGPQARSLTDGAPCGRSPTAQPSTAQPPSAQDPTFQSSFPWGNLRSAALTAVLVILLWCAGRQLALGTPLPAATSPVMGAASFVERLIVGGQAWVEGLRLALWPVNYPPQYRREFLAARQGFLGSQEFVAILGWTLACAPLLLLSIRRKFTVSALASLFVVLSFLPVTQIIPSGEILAPRFLYLPLLFAIPLIGAVLGRLGKGLPLQGKAFGLAVLLATGLFQRAQVYRDPGAWRTEMLHHHPGDAPSWNALGLWRESCGDEQAAMQAWQHSIELDPNYSRSWSNLGRLQLDRGELEAAEQTLRSAMDAGPNNPIVRVNLGTLLARRGQHAQSAELYFEATQISPGLAGAWRGLGSALGKLGRLDEARDALERALKLDPGDRAAQTLLKRLPSIDSPSR